MKCLISVIGDCEVCSTLFQLYCNLLNGLLDLSNCDFFLNQDLQNMGARNVCLMTDRNLARLPPVAAVLDSMTTLGVKYQIFEDVRVEPTDKR